MASRRAEAEALAKRVQASGFEVELRGGHHYLVRRPGDSQVLVAFTTHSGSRISLKKAEHDLIDAGVLPKREHHRKEGKMAYVSQEQQVHGDQLRKRINDYIASTGGDTPANRTAFAQAAVQAIEEGRKNGATIEQFGSLGKGRSTPVDIARESLRGLIDRRQGVTDKAWRRWSFVLDKLAPQGEGGNGSEALTKEPVDTAELLERVELAEGVVAEVERERDDARRELEESRKARAAVQEELSGLRKRFTALVAERGADNAEVEDLQGQLASAQEQIKGLNAQLRGSAGGQAKWRRELDAKIEQQNTRINELLADLDRANIDALDWRARAEEAERQLAASLAEIDHLQVESDQLQAKLESMKQQILGVDRIEGAALDRYINFLFETAHQAFDRTGDVPPWVLERLERLIETR